MKYAIKKVDSGEYIREVQEVQDNYYFIFTKEIDSAKAFWSIAEIIMIFFNRARQKHLFSIDYTIVELREVDIPRYAEVEL